MITHWFLGGLIWWLALQTLSLVTLPLAFRLFHRLPDRGYGFGKSVGLLMTSYLLWGLTSLGLVRNTRGGIVLCLLAVGVASIWFYRWRAGDGDDETLGAWLRRRWGLVTAVELLFVVSLLSWAYIRSFSPEIVGTEKPMDLAFINAVLRAERFPPHDPWLSDFGISYYYFGYLMTAVMAKLTSVSGEVAFNLGLAWQFAGTVLGGFSLVYNLVAARWDEADRRLAPAAFGILGSLLVAVMGNLEGILEVLRTRAILPGGFWRWLDIEDINVGLTSPATWPSRPGWWWWRASRVIHDRDLAGATMGIQPIDEFPFFSFLLGDMHPHVLALPFVFVALGLALNWWLGSWQTVLDGGEEGWAPVRRLFRRVDPVHLLLCAVCIGGLGFLNTWDAPIYLCVLVGALFLAILRDSDSKGLDTGYVAETCLAGLACLVVFALWARGVSAGQPRSILLVVGLILGLVMVALWRLAASQKTADGVWRFGAIGQLLVFAICVAALSFVLYLPFWFGLRSQAGGVLPNVINPTRLPQFLVMFGPFLVILLPWLAHLMVVQRASVRACGTIVLVAFGLLGGAAAAVGWLALGAPDAQGVIAQAVRQLGGVGPVLEAIVVRRLRDGWTSVLLLGIIAAATVTWRSAIRQGVLSSLSRGRKRDPVWVFVLLLVMAGALLALVPEFLYLRDNFGSRMNTVFKFYYQTWVLFAVASGYALSYLLDGRGYLRWVVGLAAVALICAGLVYPVLALESRTRGLSGPQTLDGMAHLSVSEPGDVAIIEWLRVNVSGTPTVLEAVGGQYSYGGRIAVHTGLPTVLGWAGHELQWRGETPEPRIREADVETLYTSRSWPQTEELLEKYAIQYVVSGRLEANTYGQVAAVKFERTLEKVFETEGAKVYRWNGLSK